MVSRRILLFASVGALAASQDPEKTDLFRAGSNGYSLYRIPGLIVTRNGSVLAYCEGRKNERGDWGAIDLFVRRSEDGGRTWGAAMKLPGIDGPHRKNPMAVRQGLAAEGEVTYNNPLMIAGEKRVHALFCYEYMKAFYTRSADDGRTFSRPVEITAAFEGFRTRYPWKVLAIGPGHGIRLRTGRLIAPVWISPATGGHAHRPSVTSVIYSDDSGATWHSGEIAVPDTPETVIPNEASVVELTDGRVMLNVRSESKRNRRILVYSRNGISGWSKPVFHDDLLEPICFGSTVQLSRHPERILFANPRNLRRQDGKAEPGRNRDRRNLSIHVSGDRGETWPVIRTLEQGWSGYSDLAIAKNGKVLCLYERGGLGGNAFRTEALTIARIDPEWLTGRTERRP